MTKEYVPLQPLCNCMPQLLEAEAHPEPLPDVTLNAGAWPDVFWTQIAEEIAEGLTL